MELWIRTQDKRKLLKANNFYIDIPNDFNSGSFGVYIQSKLSKIDFEKIGGYKTRERALEVLDEIQDELISTNTIPVYEKEQITCGSARVYELPEE